MTRKKLIKQRQNAKQAPAPAPIPPSSARVCVLAELAMPGLNVSRTPGDWLWASVGLFMDYGLVFLFLAAPYLELNLPQGAPKKKKVKSDVRTYLPTFFEIF
jgi:hypothetical protein